MGCATTRASCRWTPSCPTALRGCGSGCAGAEFRLTVDANHSDVTYTLRDGPGTELTIRHAGEDLELNTESPTTIEVRPRKPLLPPPPQPPGREPLHRRSTVPNAGHLVTTAKCWLVAQAFSKVASGTCSSRPVLLPLSFR